MNEIDVSNFSKIDKIVSDHFSLDEQSLKFFKDNLNSGDSIAPEFKAFLGEDRRKRINLSLDEIEGIDEGWELFKLIFGAFVEEFKVSYKNFNHNTLGKKKLIKFLLATYEGKEGIFRKSCRQVLGFGITSMNDRQVLESLLNKIGEKKFPKTNSLEFVVSANFADWFLCSTAESWDSCLSLESEYDSSYWAGLPGLIGDPNRIMVYITDGTKKEYLGIQVDKIISRAFCLLTGDNELAINRAYPIDIISSSFLKESSGIKSYRMEDLIFDTKYPVIPLYFSDGFGCFIYNDNCEFTIKKDKMFLTNSSSGYLTFSSTGEENYDSPLCYTKGLKKLIEEKGTLEAFFGGFDACEICGIAIPSGEEFFIDNEIVCSSCFNESEVECVDR